MASAREAALAALFARLHSIPQIVTYLGETVTYLGEPVTYTGSVTSRVLRNAVLPQIVPGDGLVIMRDGEPGEPDVCLNPRTEYYTHRAEIEVVVAEPAGSGAEIALDAVLEAVGAALSGDRTLAGAAENLSWGAPEVTSFAGEGTIPFLGAVIPVTIEYQTRQGLG